MNNFICTCPPGWEGHTCSININECLSTVCQNGGTCIVSDEYVGVNGWGLDSMYSGYTDMCSIDNLLSFTLLALLQE